MNVLFFLANFPLLFYNFKWKTHEKTKTDNVLVCL